MLSKIQIISIAGSLTFLLILFLCVRQKRLKEAYAILWFFFGLLMLVLSIWTDCLWTISELVGIAYPPATLFLFLLCGTEMILFQYSLLLSRSQERVSRLAQEIALLRNEVEKMRENK